MTNPGLAAAMPKVAAIDRPTAAAYPSANAAAIKTSVIMSPFSASHGLLEVPASGRVTVSLPVCHPLSLRRAYSDSNGIRLFMHLLTRITAALEPPLQQAQQSCVPISKDKQQQKRNSEKILG